MDRKTRELYARVLEQAVILIYEGAVQFSLHSQQRRAFRAIDLADAEAAILSRDARVVHHNPFHAEGVTYEITGRRANGDEIHVVIAFDTDDVSEATVLIAVTVMYPRR